MIGFEPGSWPVSYAGAECSVFEDEYDDEGPDQAQFEQMATELLWNWTGRLFGTSEVEIRPERREYSMNVPSTFEGNGPLDYAPGFGSGMLQTSIGRGYGWMPTLIAGAWNGIRCPECGGQAGCTHRSRAAIELPGPVVDVLGVVIDGVTLSRDAYWLRDKRWLIRKDGSDWPAYQNLNAMSGMAGTWSIRYTRGIEVPVGGQIAAGVLACELGKAAMGDPDCGLPKRLQSMTREGVTVGVMDPFEASAAHTWDSNAIPKVSTGIWTIDSWIAGVTAPRKTAGIHSVDLPNGRLLR
jgi:hypothetical protein